MGKYASKVVAQAQAWIGKKESDGSHRFIVDIYNDNKPLARNYKVKYTDSWCATFVSAVAIRLGYTRIIPTECSCQKMIELFKIIGCWVENENRTPNPGDIIFYDWHDCGTGDNVGWSDHVGIVEKVSGGKITVIEGNYSDSVKRRTLAVNGRYIRGYGVPRYDPEPASVPSGATTKKKTITELAREVIAGEWGSGSERKKRLQQAGHDYEDVQAKVNDLLGGPSCYEQYTGKSVMIDTVLQAIGVPAKYIGSWAKRKPLAMANDIEDYRGKSGQNLSLIALAKKGKLRKP